MARGANRNGETMREALITGMGIVSAVGDSLDQHRKALSAPVVNCNPVPAWLFDTTLEYPVFYARKELVDEIVLSTRPDFDLCCFYGMNRTMDLMLYALLHALCDAGLDVWSLRDVRVGIAVGTTVGCTFNDEKYYDSWRRGEKSLPCPVLSYVSSNLASSMHDYLGTSGPSMVITNACASGTDAIGLASDWIVSGLCDVALAGGADELSRIAYNGFASLMLASESPCRPFDRRRNGLNLGEGSGMLVMESGEHLEATGRERYLKGFSRGYGTASDAWHPTAPHPGGRGLVSAVSAAMADAGLESLEDVAFINAHGTGTLANDSAESEALVALRADRLDVPVVSTKGMTGHTLGAAGAIEAILTLLALEEGVLHGTAGCVEPDFSLSGKPLPQGEKARLEGRVAISQSLAFGGGNSAIVLESVV